MDLRDKSRASEKRSLENSLTDSNIEELDEKKSSYSSLIFYPTVL